IERMFGAPDNLRTKNDELEAEMARLNAILATRRPAAGADFDISADITKAIEALRKQNQELEIAAATFGMAAGEAARYRLELQAMAATRDIGPSAERDRVVAQYQAEIDRAAALTQQRADQQRGHAAGQREQRLEIGREGQIEQLELQIETLGK